MENSDDKSSIEIPVQISEKERLEILKLKLENKDLENCWLRWAKGIVGFAPLILAVGTLLIAGLSGFLSTQASINKNESLINELKRDSLQKDITRFEFTKDSLSRIVKIAEHQSDSIKVQFDLYRSYYIRDSTSFSNEREKANQLQKAFNNISKNEPEKIKLLFSEIERSKKNIADTVEYYKNIIENNRENLVSSFKYRDELNFQMNLLINKNNALSEKIAELEKK